MTVLARVRATGQGLSTGTPLLILLYGFPIWWVLGFGELAFLIAALPMGLHLWRIRSVLTVPKGFSLWLFFLLVVLVSALTLPARAPLAIGGGNVLTYGYRLGWYLSVTIVLLYVGNLGPRWTMSRRIPEAVAFMFLVTVAGGVLGLVASDWEAPSLLARVLPGGLGNVPFVNSLVTLDLADTQSILGYEQVRPKAPYQYANSWGASFSAFLPFFLFTWCRRSAGWRLLATPFILAAAAVVVVATLNRALWATLIVGALYAAVQVIRLRGLRGFVVVYAAFVASAVLIFASGLASTVEDRVENPHSNDRRSELAVKTIESVAAGSPLVGFGNTRDVKGNFDSIAGGATPDCQACGVPPFGTQGTLWLVLFAQGLLGAISFLGFILYRMNRSIRARDARTVVLLAVPLFLILQLPFYDSSGIPLFTTMIALALMWRSRVERRSAGPDGIAAVDSSRAVEIAGSIARGVPLAAVAGGCLAVAAGGVAIATPRDYRATVDVLVHAAPVHLPLSQSSPRTISADTEARRALSDEVLAGVAWVTGDSDPRDSVDVSAYTGTQVLRLSYTHRSPTSAAKGAAAFAEAYVAQRSDFIDARAESALSQILASDPLNDPLPGIQDSGPAAKQAWARALANREVRVARVIASSAASAEVVREPTVVEARRNVTVDVANGLAIGILISIGWFSWVRRGRGSNA